MNYIVSNMGEKVNFSIFRLEYLEILTHSKNLDKRIRFLGIEVLQCDLLRFLVTNFDVLCNYWY